MKRLSLLLIVLLFAGCGGKLPPDLSPEARAAYYGEAFMARVEQAQTQTIALVGQAGITRADVTPAVEVFVQIGKGGQGLAAALKVIDESNITADKQSAAIKARAALDVFQNLLNTATVRVTSEAARARIAQVIAAVKLGAALFDVVQRLAPLLPTQTPSSRIHEPVLVGGMA